MTTEVETQTTTNPLPGASPPKYEFSFDNFLKQEYGFGLDSSRPICKAFLQGHCPLGNNCPDKHHTPPGYNSLVCKHWMRALCKKGDQCEFLHEYNLRRMPECINFSRYGSCPNGEDCMYQHLDPEAHLPPCPQYERGFCPLGPLCARRHVRKEKLCPFYLAGFCPDGKDCKHGAHARFPLDLPKPVVKGSEAAEALMGEESGPAASQQPIMSIIPDDDSVAVMPVRSMEDSGFDSQDRQDRQGGQSSGQSRGRGGWPQRGKRGRGGFKRGRGS